MSGQPAKSKTTVAPATGSLAKFRYVTAQLPHLATEPGGLGSTQLSGTPFVEPSTSIQPDCSVECTGSGGPASAAEATRVPATHNSAASRTTRIMVAPPRNASAP